MTDHDESPEFLQAAIEKCKRNLRTIELQSLDYGSNIPLSLTNEINNEKGRLSFYQERLAKISKNSSNESLEYQFAMADYIAIENDDIDTLRKKVVNNKTKAERYMFFAGLFFISSIILLIILSIESKFDYYDDPPDIKGIQIKTPSEFQPGILTDGSGLENQRLKDITILNDNKYINYITKGYFSEQNTQSIYNYFIKNMSIDNWRQLPIAYTDPGILLLYFGVFDKKEYISLIYIEDNGEKRFIFIIQKEAKESLK